MKIDLSGRVSVSGSGYEWTQEDGGTLVPRRRDGDEPLSLREYDPLRDCPCLFIVFSRIPPERQALNDFADQYGSFVEPDSLKHRRLGWTFDQWWDKIKQFQDALELWRFGQIGDKPPKPDSEATPKLNNIGIDRKKLATRASYPWAHGDRLPELLKAHISSLVDVIKPCDNPVQRKFAFEMRVEGLEQALWTQFVVAVIDDLRFQDCLSCGKPILLTPDRTRSDRKYCSNTCQMRAYRHRMGKAKKMRLAGKTLREIAKEFNTTLATVRAWIDE